MKKLGILLGIALMLCSFSLDSYAKNWATKNGFSVNAVLGFPSKVYGAEKADDVDDEVKFGAMFGLQLGNRWYFSPSESGGIGLMVNWFDITYAGKKGSDDGGDWARIGLEMGFIELGPVGTLALSEEMAIDGYYNLRPTFLSSAFATTDIGSDEITIVGAGFGMSHAIGAAFRFKALNVGFEYVVGAINSKVSATGLSGIDFEDVKNKTNSFRIMLGAKF